MVVSGVILVRCGTRRLALPIEDVLEILPVEGLLAAPAARPAVRGLLPVRDRLVPLVHLHALLEGASPPADAGAGAAAVLVRSGGRRLALEVDEALDLLRDVAVTVPSGWDVPWARGVARADDALLPVVELGSLVDRLVGGPEGDR